MFETHDADPPARRGFRVKTAQILLVGTLVSVLIGYEFLWAHDSVALGIFLVLPCVMGGLLIAAIEVGVSFLTLGTLSSRCFVPTCMFGVAFLVVVLAGQIRWEQECSRVRSFVEDAVRENPEAVERVRERLGSASAPLLLRPGDCGAVKSWTVSSAPGGHVKSVDIRFAISLSRHENLCLDVDSMTWHLHWT